MDWRQHRHEDDKERLVGEQYLFRRDYSLVVVDNINQSADLRHQQQQDTRNPNQKRLQQAPRRIIRVRCAQRLRRARI